jgi:alpha-D-xyloside xylohydrolase
VPRSVPPQRADSLCSVRRCSEEADRGYRSFKAVSWYQEKLAKLLEMGVAVYTADFGEAARLIGIYHESTSSFLEHNLYPLRYNKAVADVTR